MPVGLTARLIPAISELRGAHGRPQKKPTQLNQKGKAAGSALILLKALPKARPLFNFNCNHSILNAGLSGNNRPGSATMRTGVPRFDIPISDLSGADQAPHHVFHSDEHGDRLSVRRTYCGALDLAFVAAYAAGYWPDCQRDSGS